MSTEKTKRLSLTERLDVVEKLFTDVNAAVCRHEKTLSRHAKALKYFDEHKAAKVLDSIEARVLKISARLQIELLKQFVCTEVSRLFPSDWPLLVRALDADDEWWFKGRSLSMGGWHERLAELDEPTTTRQEVSAYFTAAEAMWEGM